MNKQRNNLALSIAIALTCLQNAFSQQEISAVLNAKRSDVYLNETVTLTLSVRAKGYTLGQDFSLQNVPSEQQLRKLSDLERMPVKHSEEDNTPVELHEFKVKFQPASIGLIKIAPKLRFSILTRQRSFWGTSTVQQQAAMDVKPITLRVLPLPETGKPAGFQNAVGKFTFEVQVKPSDVAVGDLINVRMTVEGSGYLDEMQPLQITTGDRFKTYPSQSVEESAGLRTFEQIVIPTSTNASEIAALSFSYFDPDACTYRTIRQGPFPITFHPEKNTSVERFKPADMSDNEFKNDGSSTSRIAKVVTFADARNGAATKTRTDVRLAPAFSSLITFEIPADSAIKTLETHADWIKVEYNNNRGWIPASSLK